MKRHCFLALALGLLFSQAFGRAGEELPPLPVNVRVHLVHSTSEASLNTTLTEADVQRIFGKVNKVWAQGGIHFEVESICETPPNEDTAPLRGDEARWLAGVMPRAGRLARGIDVYYVKEITPNGIWTGGIVVVKDTARLREVPGGIDEPLPRVTSHELGHALGLPHRQDVTNLMASGTTGFSLNDAEIAIARATAERKYGLETKDAAPAAPAATSAAAPVTAK